MAAILTRVSGGEGTPGRYREITYDITFDAAYTTTGVAISAKDAGFVSLLGFKIIGRATVSGAAQTSYMVADYDFKTGKLQLWGTAGSATGLTEIANATALATVVIRAVAMGI